MIRRNIKEAVTKQRPVAKQPAVGALTFAFHGKPQFFSHLADATKKNKEATDQEKSDEAIEKKKKAKKPLPGPSNTLKKSPAKKRRSNKNSSRAK